MNKSIKKILRSEERTTTTPFDMVVLNKLDRFHLAANAVGRLPQLGSKGVYFKQYVDQKLVDHKIYTQHYGEDLPEIRDWKWAEDNQDEKSKNK